MRAMALGVLASLFFSVTFVLNRAMSLQGGNWMWSASLRFFFMLPLLGVIVCLRGNFMPLWRMLNARPLQWVLWSSVGFGLFYAPLCFSAAYGAAWVVAATWQVTVVAGSLLAPLFMQTMPAADGTIRIRAKVPVRGLAISLVILAGVFAIQMQQGSNSQAGLHTWLLGSVPVLAAAVAYPLGNRKMMEVCAGALDPYQRLLGMTIASLPVWIVLAVIGRATAGAPQASQVWQALLVSLFSGVIATALFFAATDAARGNMTQLAAVEATQSGEVVFTVLGEAVVLGVGVPNVWAWLGLILIVLGVSLHSYASHPAKNRGAGELQQPTQNV